MTDVWFTLCATASLSLATLWLVRASPHRFAATIAFAALAALTRPEGILFVPLVPILTLWHLRREGLRSTLTGSWGFAFWGLWAWWRFSQNASGAYGGTFRKNLARISLDHLHSFSYHLGGYAVMTLLIFGPGVLLGIWLYSSRMLSERTREGAWGGLLLGYLFAGAYLISCIHFFFSTRHLIYAMPVMCVWGALGWAWWRPRAPRLTNAMVGLSIAWLLGYSAYSLVVTKDAFYDVRLASERAGQDLTGRIFAKDHGLRKSSFHSGHKTHKLRLHGLRPGDRVMLDSFDIQRKGVSNWLRKLQQRYEVEILLDQRVIHRNALADDIGEDTRRNGKASWVLTHLFRPQHFRSMALEIKGPRRAKKEPR